MRTRLLLVLCILFLPCVCAARDVTFPSAPLAIRTHEKTLHFTVEVATSSEQQQHGLMFRRSLADSQGMIFIFTPPRPVIFWMKNTPLPLDMLFIDGKGRVMNITRMATPESTDPISSGGTVTAVLELKGGLAAKYHIEPGDKVIYPLFP